VTAADLRLLGQRQAVAYGADLRRGEVTGLRRARDRTRGFVATVKAADEAQPDDEVPGLAGNRAREQRHGARLGERETRRRSLLRARTVLLATGVVDAFPAFAGRDECVGISLFWCIVCDGYEAIGRHVAVVGDDEDAIGTAFGLLHLTDRVTLVTGRRRSHAPSRRLRALEDRGARVVRGTVDVYHHEAGRISSITVTPVGRGRDRIEIECEMVFVSTPKCPRTELARRLGAGSDDAGYLATDEAGRTTVSGLYAAGDATAEHSHQVTTAAHLGATAATAVNWDLYDPVERDEAPV
jgi:thioredoxin reductase